MLGICCAMQHVLKWSKEHQCCNNKYRTARFSTTPRILHAHTK